MRNFLLINVKQYDGAPRPTCRLVKQLYSKDPSYHPHDYINFDMSVKTIQEGIQVVEVIKSVTLRPREVDGVMKQQIADYVKPVHLPASCITAPMLNFVSMNPTCVPTASIFEVCRLGVSGLVTQDSMAWVHLYLDLYRRSVAGDPILTRETSNFLVKACCTWFEKQVNGKFVLGADKSKHLAERLQNLPGYPHYWLPSPGITVTTGDEITVTSADFLKVVVDAPAVLNGKIGTVINAKAVIRRSGLDVYYIVTAIHDAPKLCMSTKLMLDAATMSKAMGKKSKASIKQGELV